MTLQRFTDRWMPFWFTPQPADDLGLCRLLFFGGLCAFYLPTDFAAWGALPEVFWMPIGTFQAAHIPPPTVAVVAGLQVVWKGALVLSTLGLLTRPAIWVSFALGFYLLGLPHNFGKTHHIDALIVIMLGILAMARSGDAWSLDRFFQRRRSPLAPQQIVASGEYTWPIRAAQVALCLVFFAAGFTKLSRSGLVWVFSDNLATAIIKQNYYVSDVPPLTERGLDLAASPWMSRGLAAATLILELGYPLALVGKIPRLIFVPGMILAQVGFRVLMGPMFFAFMLGNVFWVPWSRWLGVRRNRQKLPPHRPATDPAEPVTGHALDRQGQSSDLSDPSRS